MSVKFQDLTPQRIAYLESIVGAEYVSTSAADLDQHSRDQSFHKPHRPGVVVWPASAEEISTILRYANAERIPVTPWGAGSSLEGNPIPVHGGIVLDMHRLDKIIALRAEDFQVDVQTGALYKDVNAALARHGLFFAPDPGANASIGGMIANNAAGTRTPRYGATKENVLRLEVVLASGEIIRTGTRSRKTSSGYDLVHVFTGSEGTLGIVTEATLRLAPLPEKFSAAIVSFPTTESATRAVSGIMGSGITPAALEFLDCNTVQALNASGEFTLPENPTLLMEFHSATEAGLKEERKLVEAICTEESCTTFQAGIGRDARDRLWRVRHQTYEILLRRHPGVAFLIVDVAAAVSDYPRLVETVEHELAQRGLLGYLIGHAGDGNIHPLIAYTPGDKDSYAAALAASQAMVKAAIALEGTATGEHGVGIGKRAFMALEHGGSLKVMRAIKNALDPNGILNPGKVL
jgi:D-lactate dehydrogenase (cytochrome)